MPAAAHTPPPLHITSMPAPPRALHLTPCAHNSPHDPPRHYTAHTRRRIPSHAAHAASCRASCAEPHTHPPLRMRAAHAAHPLPRTRHARTPCPATDAASRRARLACAVHVSHMRRQRLHACGGAYGVWWGVRGGSACTCATCAAAAPACARSGGAHVYGVRPVRRRVAAHAPQRTPRHACKV